MKRIITLLLICFVGVAYSQGYDSDLYELKKENTLKSFYNSDKKKMFVKSYISVSRKALLEYSTSYKKNFFFKNVINFKLKYSENYVLNDYDKAFGEYKLAENGLVLKYERTDFGGDNKLILGTEYHTFTYQNDFVIKDRIRFKEYINVGAVDLDTVSTTDYLNYVVETKGDSLFYSEKEAEGASVFIIKNELIVKEISHLVGYTSESNYYYNKENQLIKKDIFLISDETQNRIKTSLILTYNAENLLSKTEFFDEKDRLLEKKLFSYK